MKNPEVYVPQMSTSNGDLDKVDKKPIQKSYRSLVKKVVVGIATVATIAGITYGCSDIYQNTGKDLISVDDSGYPDATPCPAPSDPRKKEVVEANPVVVNSPKTANPCPTPSNPIKLG